MAITNKRLCANTLTAANATLYTAPVTAGNYTVIKSITLCNKTSANHTVNLKFNGIDVIFGHTILANDTITVPFIDQIIEASELIEGSADAVDSITYYISGKEVT